MAELPLPVWSEREQSTIQITDVSEDRAWYSAAMRIKRPADSPDTDFVDWVNQYRRPIHAELQTFPATNVLADCGIEATDLADAVAGITDTPHYPLKRLVATSALAGIVSYKTAIDAVTPGFSIDEAEDFDGQYNAMLGVLILNSRVVADGERARIADSTAFILGEAAIGSVVDVSIRREPQPKYRRWSGYQWWCNDTSYGAFLHKGAAAKISALVRQELDIPANGSRHADPRIEPYRRSDEFYFGYDAGAAMTLDTINWAAGIPDSQPGIYRAIWEFGINGRDEAAREAAAGIVRTATKNQVRLEELEAIDVSDTFPLDVLARVEEAGRVPAGQRISEYEPRFYS